MMPAKQPPTILLSHASAAPKALPFVLQQRTRAGDTSPDPLLAGILVKASYSLDSRRSLQETGTQTISANEGVLALEADDGSTLFISPESLEESLLRSHPEAFGPEGQMDFGRIREKSARRGIEDSLWKTVSLLGLPADGLLEEAGKLLADWVKGTISDKVESKLTDTGYSVGSYLGAKALMWVIESHLAGRTGLYRWQEKHIHAQDYCSKDDCCFEKAANGAPMLVFIHGTASFTTCAFSDLRSDDTQWAALANRYTGGIFGYEHRTFSQSPIENALELLQALPSNARVSLVTHSRGGLIGDLLCLDQQALKAVERYTLRPKQPPGTKPDPEGLAEELAREQQRLREILGLLKQKNLVIERYVRVASPASGTRLVSDNLDVALSSLLSLIKKIAGASASLAACFVGGPPAAIGAGTTASSALGVLSRLTLEIVGRRIDPRLVPGIAVVRADSPLLRLLASPDAPPRHGIGLAIVAGDTEFEGFGLNHLGRRIANLLCDWRIYDGQDNDLIVDTQSMFEGIAPRADASYLFDQGPMVNHFRYFVNPATRNPTLAWLGGDPSAASAFRPLNQPRTPQHRGATRDAEVADDKKAKPVLIFLPGIMGSHLAIRDGKSDIDRIWFNPLRLVAGQLDRIGDIKNKKIFAEDIWEKFYGDLANFLAESHHIIRQPYDWRKPIPESASALADTVTKALKDFPGQPIRLLAHSMGGLVARAMISAFPSLWEKIIASGGRLLMLGTPNNGAHLMVHTLLGKTDSMRGLTHLDVTRDLQEVLDIVAGFPGALSLLPRPAMVASGNAQSVSASLYYEANTWQRLRDSNQDRWFGNGVAGLPDQDTLNTAAKFWNEVLRSNEVPRPEYVSFVYGQGEKTPCDLTLDENGRLELVFTTEGDGSVTWNSSRLDNLGEERCWYLPAEHCDLTGIVDTFPAILELVTTGQTEKLGRLPKTRGLASNRFSLEAAPPAYFGEDALARAMQGSKPRKPKALRHKACLHVSVRSGDLRFVDQPVICGHYIGDPLAAAEATLDTMLDGRLRERERLGVYATEICTSAIVLKNTSPEEKRRGSRPGAIIVGLGQFTGQLGSRQITETVRAAALRLLLQLQNTERDQELPIEVYSLLIGCNSTTHISIEESVKAITVGVLEANYQFNEVCRGPAKEGFGIEKLSFLELYRDAAISAAHAVAELGVSLKSVLRQFNTRLEPAGELIVGDGTRERLSATGNGDYWARMIVTDAASVDPLRPSPNGRSERQSSPYNLTEKALGASNPSDHPRYFPSELKYVFLSQRARAETLVQQRQPGLVEALLATRACNSGVHNPELGKTLFQLLVPLDYKATARERQRLLLVLDSYTATLPWELLQSGDEPLAVCMPMVRQLITSNYRNRIATATENTACVIVAPSTYGFNKRFPSEPEALAELTGAIAEGDAVRTALEQSQWLVEFCPEGKPAIDVLPYLYRRPYRMLVVCGHGIFEAMGQDGRLYTGVVLSDGMLITAVEIGLMEVVPEVVFLNCCYLGSLSTNSQPNRLAYSLAQELIEMGVRCVVVAGWPVDDAAAQTFSTTFFSQLTNGRPFGDAIFMARRATFEKHPFNDTWGAYQAYGDPSYRMSSAKTSSTESNSKFVAIEELLQALSIRRVSLGKTTSTLDKEITWVQHQLARCPSNWGQRREVLHAIAALYSEFDTPGYAVAREAYLASLSAEEGCTRGAISTIEQLANIEARLGEKRARSQSVEEGMALITSAIHRLEDLNKATIIAQRPIVDGERAGLLGSAWKKLAMAKAAVPGTAWDEVRKALECSADAYLSASNPSYYQILNALPLKWLSRKPTNSTKAPETDLDLAMNCAQEATRRFSQSKDFFDAAGTVDADMVTWLLSGAPKEKIKPLHLAYADLKQLPSFTQRKWDSVTSQILAIAIFLEAKANAESSPASQEAIDLKRVASSLRSFTSQTENPSEKPHRSARPTQFKSV